MKNYSLLDGAIDIFANSTPAEINDNGDLVPILDESKVMPLKRNAFNKLKGAKNTIELADRYEQAKKVVRGLERAHKKSILTQLEECYLYINARI